MSIPQQLRERWGRLRFATKIQSLLIALSCGLTIAVVLSAGWIGNRTTESRLRTDFERNAPAVREILETRLSLLDESLRLGISNPTFRATLSGSSQSDQELGLGLEEQTPGDGSEATVTGDKLAETNATLGSIDLPFVRDFPVAAILEPSGRVLFSKNAREPRFGQELQDEGFIGQILSSDEKAYRLISPRAAGYQDKGIFPAEDSSLYLMVGRAVNVGGTAIGVVLAAEPVGATWLPALERVFFAQAGIRTSDGQIERKTSTTAPASPSAFEELLSGLQAESEPALRTYRNQTGERQIALFVPVRRSDGSLLAQIFLERSLDAELHDYRTGLRIVTFLLIVAALGLSLLLGRVFSRQLTVPVSHLISGVRQLQTGDLSSEVKVIWEDELGQLGHSFNRMIRSLREKVELERLNTRLLSELKAARDIQSALLPPHTLEIGPLRLEALYKPSTELSGDFFDLIETPDWIYIYVADVTSHGAAAAQVTYLVKGLFKHTIERGGFSDLPGLMKLVQAGYSNYSLSHNVSIQVIRISRSDWSFEYTRGAAPNLFCLNQGATDEKTVFTTRPGPALSADPGATGEGFFTTPGRVLPEISLFLFTDGAYEFPYEGKTFGLKRLQTILRKLRPGTEGEGGIDWRKQLLDELQAANLGESFEDDITLLRLSLRA